MAEFNSTPPRAPGDKSVGELVLDISEKTSSLIREEIELAKTEVTEKVTSLLKGGVVGIVAGVFAFLALILFMIGIGFGINALFFGNLFYPGFLIEGFIFVLIGAAAGYFAYRSIQAGAPPVPAQAIEEAKLTRAMLEGSTGEGAPGGTVGATTPGATSAAPTTPPEAPK
jgi:Putative Actinobacterial Holin-X, holin superfamily III